MRKRSLWLLTALLVAAASLVAMPVSAQTAYTSPTYGFSVTLPAGWTIDSQTSDGRTDVLRFSNPEVVAFLTAYASDETPADCIESMVETIQGRPNHDNFAFAVPIAEQPGTASATFGYTFITAAGEQLAGRDRMTCWEIEEGGMVRLEFLVLENDLQAQEAAIEEVETAVNVAVQPLLAAEAQGLPAATPLPSEPAVATETATSEATVTEAPATPAAEEGAFEEAATPEPTSTGTVSEPSPPSDDEIVSPNITGNSYVSPSFSYGLTWSDDWTVSGEESDTRGDYLGLEHADGIFADLIGEPYPADTGNCFDFIVDYYSNHEDYTNVVGTMDSVSAAPGLWDYTGVMLATTTSSSGASLDLVNYLSCSHVPNELAIVSLEQVVLPDLFDQLRPEMDALRQGFVISTLVETTPEGQVAPSPTPEATAAGTVTPSGTPSSGATTAGSAVAGSTYTSPTYGYRLTWDDTWIVNEESAEGRDYLSLDNGAVVAELLSEEWVPGTGNCFEWIVEFYATHADYSDVRASQDAVSAAPDNWEITGAIAMSQADGTGERINYVACSEIPGQDVIVSLEQFVYPIDAPGQLTAMDALREGFSLT
ncbi:MAG: hypothetical protein AB7V46_01905 [Thermomicrobiales bacterium]